jgi:DNA-binding transcriptional ArsR family regulator
MRFLITRLLTALERAARRRRMELQGAKPYDWRRTIRRARLGPSVKLVACLLADYASPDGTSIRPGNPRLVAVSELSDKTVRTALSKLRDMGLIERTFAGSRMGRRGLADEYRLTFPIDVGAIGEMLAVEEIEMEQHGTPVVSTGDQHETPVTSTDDAVENPVDNSAHTAPPDPGTPVNRDGTPVTDDRNTGTGYRPPNQAPNHLHLPTPPVVPVTPPTVEVPSNRAVTDSERADLHSDDETLQFKAAHAILNRCGLAEYERLSEKAQAELDNPNLHQLMIRAAQIHVGGNAE